ncbi:hypothetical protein LSH36_745g02062 [Paralvinella palmiformis]|uniref:Uncharacterized protein n=1 Tax=Paralvinella palmiformis TaxID=53620 RepID=A0AAD9J1U9_9ANNE|nr:hypothetical protein LSH36_745g02062 [Paralvinella palmiformis]
MHQFIVEDAVSCSDVECFRQEMNNKETTNDPDPLYCTEEDSSGSSLIMEESIIINQDEQIEMAGSTSKDNTLPETSVMTRSSHKDTNDKRLVWFCCSGRIPRLSLNQHSLYVGVVEKPPPPPLTGEQYGKMEPKYPETETFPKNITRLSLNTEKEYAMEGYSKYQGKYQKRVIMYIAGQLQTSRDELTDHPHKEQIWCSVKTGAVKPSS